MYTRRMRAFYPTVRDEDPRPSLEIRRTLRSRQQRHKSHWVLESIGVVLVLLMSTLSAAWISSKLSIDLSQLTAPVVALAAPRDQPEHRIVGYTGQDAARAGDPSQAPAQNPTPT